MADTSPKAVTEWCRDLRKHCPDGWSGNANAEFIEALAAQLATAREALKLLVSDVQNYEAWQRPCHALDIARAALNDITPRPADK